ncbi:hypothetical protein [Oceanospirillum beijerinckii]|uniref:hypothetical protein n=1 Tax=Oceanospirillum beijerinckii TaxID=64976 RepID=UPI0006877A85|nr:hypothetical protein [Oceanospirillum beijerinckii]
MKEVDLLKSMWKPKPRRSQELVVPKITMVGAEDAAQKKGDLNNSHWAYIVPFGFRSALDLKFLSRKKTIDDGKGGKKKVTYWAWTQGPIIAFKANDVLTPKKTDTQYTLQVFSAIPMGWDKENNEMYQGSVVYRRYDDNWQFADQKEVTQMEFLQYLITGEEPTV